MSEKDRQAAHTRGPRRHVRYIYLVDVWPEAAKLEHIDAFEQAPDSAVIAALNVEIETIHAVLASERAAREHTEREVKGLRAAYRLIGPDTTFVVPNQGRHQ